MKYLGLLLVLSLGLGVNLTLSGCGDDEDAACISEGDGDLLLSTDRLVESAPDSLSNVKMTISGAVLSDILDFTSGVPRRIIYRFTAPGRSTFDLILEYIGFTLPVVEGETYTLYIERTQNLTPAAKAYSISDSVGIRYLGVNDWKPEAGVFENGFPDLGGEDFRVAYLDAGCTPRLENTDCYRSITNYRLDFFVGSGSALTLRNGESGQTGGWVFRAHKAEQVIAKACGLLDANGMSFSVEREGLR
jgi:hypothetical protein